MAKAMHAESVYRHLPFNAAKVAAQFVNWMGDPDVRVFCYDQKGQKVGLLVASVGTHWFSDGLGAWDHLYYVKPDARGSFAAARLFQAFTAWAKAQGAVDLWPGVSTGSAAAVTFYRRLGLEEVGGVFRGAIV